jgi:hypothetical protein
VSGIGKLAVMPPRLVLLRHDVPDTFGRPGHWDLLLERAEDCWTWAIEELPAGLGGEGARTSVSATRLANHRKHYLDYEGPVSGDRGEVTRAIMGTYELVSHSETRVELDATIQRKRMRLTLELERANSWRLNVLLQ